MHACTHILNIHIIKNYIVQKLKRINVMQMLRYTCLLEPYDLRFINIIQGLSKTDRLAHIQIDTYTLAHALPAPYPTCVGPSSLPCLLPISELSAERAGVTNREIAKEACAAAQMD